MSITFRKALLDYFSREYWRMFLQNKPIWAPDSRQTRQLLQTNWIWLTRDGTEFFLNITELAAGNKNRTIKYQSRWNKANLTVEQTAKFFSFCVSWCECVRFESNYDSRDCSRLYCLHRIMYATLKICPQYLLFLWAVATDRSPKKIQAKHFFNTIDMFERTSLSSPEAPEAKFSINNLNSLEKCSIGRWCQIGCLYLPRKQRLTRTDQFTV